jgi:hypothetical protein
VDLFIIFNKVVRRRLADIGGKFGGSKGFQLKDKKLKILVSTSNKIICVMANKN